MFEVLLRIGKRLTKLGYRESSKKANLFYRKTPDGDVFFADMRGTEEVPIWEEPRPLFYWRISSTDRRWLTTRIIKQEFKRLTDGKCYPRLSFYEDMDPDGPLSGLHYEYAAGLFRDETQDGYCKECGKDFQEDGLYCSQDCKAKAQKKEENEHYKRAYAQLLRERQAITCSLCGRHPNIVDEETLEQFIEHHTSYEPEQTITLCRSCHQKLHKSGVAKGPPGPIEKARKAISEARTWPAYPRTCNRCAGLVNSEGYCPRCGIYYKKEGG